MIYLPLNHISMKKIAIFAIISVILLSACQKAEIQTKKNNDLEEAAKQVVKVLKNKDLESLAAYVHPNKGVRFSPYAYVDAQNDVTMMAADLNGKFDEDSTLKWGLYDGSGEPIELTFSEYYEKFIYDQDFENAERFACNELLKTGNTICNINEAYPDAEFAEYHFTGFDPEYAGMDWVSLRLVFEKYEDSWMLVGIIHDQWTI